MRSTSIYRCCGVCRRTNSGPSVKDEAIPLELLQRNWVRILDDEDPGSSAPSCRVAYPCWPCIFVTSSALADGSSYTPTNTGARPGGVMQRATSEAAGNHEFGQASTR